MAAKYVARVSQTRQSVLLPTEDEIRHKIIEAKANLADTQGFCSCVKLLFVYGTELQEYAAQQPPATSIVG